MPQRLSGHIIELLPPVLLRAVRNPVPRRGTPGAQAGGGARGRRDAHGRDRLISWPAPPAVGPRLSGLHRGRRRQVCPGELQRLGEITLPVVTRTRTPGR